MDFPRTIKIGYRDYEIVAWPHLDAAQAGRYGQTEHLARKIKVDASLDGREAAATLLHEILHAVWRMSEMDTRKKPADEEEFVVASLSTGLAGAWRDNPAVFAWIAANLADAP